MFKHFFLMMLEKSLVALHQHKSNQTFKNYKRLNPFFENIIDWKTKKRHFGKIGENVTIYDSTTLVGDIEIGDNTWIGPFCSIDGPGRLKIGSFCSIAAGVQILTHDSVKWALSGGKCEYEYAAVEIGNNCFIGTHAIINKGVKLGNCCLVAANAVVTKSFPDNSIIAGVPARQIGRLVTAEKEITYEYF